MPKRRRYLANQGSVKICCRATTKRHVLSTNEMSAHVAGRTAGTRCRLKQLRHLLPAGALALVAEKASAPVARRKGDSCCRPNKNLHLLPAEKKRRQHLPSEIKSARVASRKDSRTGCRLPKRRRRLLPTGASALAAARKMVGTRCRLNGRRRSLPAGRRHLLPKKRRHLLPNKRRH